jgi:prepilin-type N-terminal cleavage/methylation domain-containing protein/prepilin-type processing-associated H-X9-DG protein
MLRINHRGLSLIELLVVIAIITILASIVLPVYATIRNKARMAVCQSNLRQIAIAFRAYLDDWDSCYPNTGNPFLWMGRFWRWPLKPYVGLSANPVPGDPLHSTNNTRNILLCPSDLKAEERYDSTSYAYSMAFYVAPSDIDRMTTFADTVTPPGPPCTTQREENVTYPSKKVLVTEWFSNHESPHVGWNDPATAWEGSRNYLFADGHVQYLKARQIKPANNGLPDINLTKGGITGKDVE